MTADDQTSEPASGRQVGGAAVVGGVAGLILFGPIVAAVAAVGGAVAAQSRGKTGDVARSCGEATASMGDKLKQLNEDHHVVEKTKNAASGAVRSAKKFDQEHRVVEKVSNSIVASADYVSRKLSPSTSTIRRASEHSRNATV